MSITPSGLSFIKSWEGFRGQVYLDVVNLPTIGYGHLLTPLQEAHYLEHPITEPQALALLLQDLGRYESIVDKYVKVKLADKQRDALVSFCYNVGIGAFINSTLLRKLNQHDWSGASNEFGRWNKGGKPPKPIEGLTRRRESERRMFIQDIPAKHKFGLLKLQDICLLPLSWEHPEYVRRARHG